MTDNLYSFTTNFAYENNLDADTATRLVKWLETENVLDHETIDEVYSEPSMSANDNEGVRE